MVNYHLLFPFLAILLLNGCSVFKAGPIEESGFLNINQKLEKNERFPFHAWWVKPGAVKSQGGKIYLAPVNTSYLKLNNEWSRIDVLSEEEVHESARELAGYFREKLIEEFDKGDKKTFQIADKVENSDGTLEIAIVELTPTDVARTGVGTILGIFLPGAGVSTIYSSGTIAIEGRFIDNSSGEIVAAFKDRESGKIAPIDFAGLTAFRYSKVAINDWSEQIVEILESPPGSVTHDSLPFTLMPW